MAALGLARAELVALEAAGGLPSDLAEMGATLLRLQRELFVAGAELATDPDAWGRLRDGQTRVDEAMLVGLEELLSAAEDRVPMPREFVIPGGSRFSAALELARTVVRRAERRVVALERERLVPGAWIMPYLNRLADLLWVMARVAEQAQEAGWTPRRGPEDVTHPGGPPTARGGARAPSAVTPPAGRP